jgi:hypothetical protein
VESVAPLPLPIPIQPPILSAAPLPPRADEITPAADTKPVYNPPGESSLLHYALLVAVIALGGVLRFICLDRPSIWGDEAATFGRASGTFPELMARLQSAGFAPVHYELVWWIGQHTLLTPFMMRLVPAITGTLMIPAMYCLAAQLIGRRPALLTALLTATNAFLLNYSRDAKMYSPFWFFAAVNVAALLWWLRVRTPTSWCVWIASGTAMVGFDALGWITVAIELLMVLTTQRANWLSLLRLAVLLFFASVIWCLTLGLLVFSVLIAAHALDGTLKKIAIAVIALAILRVIWLTVGFWLGRRRIIPFFHWPTERSLARPWIARRVAAFRWPPIILFVFGLLIMLAGPFGYYYDFNRYLERVDTRGWNSTGIQWVEPYNAGRSGPSLVGYTASAFLTSWEWPRTDDARDITPRTLRLLTAGTLSIAAALALGLLPIPWARRLNPSPGIGGWRSALWLMLWLSIPPYAFYCVSMKEHVGPQSWLMAARDVLRDKAWLAIFIGLALGWFCMAGSTWRQRAVRVFQLVVILFVSMLIIQGIHLIYPKIDAALAAQSEAWRDHGSVWMPRYIAVILPAVLIIATALLWRLPTRPLRWAAVGLVLIVNLSVHGARVFAGSEQPSALMAHDILNSQRGDSDGTIRAYFQPSLQAGGAEPGSISLYSPAMRYYITILSPRTAMPINQVLASQLNYRVAPGRNMWMTFTGFIINEVRRSPKLQTFITWERLEPHEIDQSDKPLDALEPDWRLQSEQTFAVRDHWRWKDTCVLRRRVYVRTSSGQS